MVGSMSQNPQPAAPQMKTRSANGKLKPVKYEEDAASDNQGSEARVSEYDESSDDDSRPPQKRRRSYASGKQTGRSMKVRGGKIRGKNVGKLSKLFDMPTEIFSEIAGHLEPLDLLRLARSTRLLNQVLMSRDSRPIWRAARSSFTGLPDCPPDLSEPEYARLLFEKDCQVCLAPRAMKVDWTLRSRLCKHCRTDRIQKGSILLAKIPDLTEELLGCIPCHINYWATNNHREFEFYSVRVSGLVAKYRAAVPEGLPADQAEIRRQAFINQQKELIPVITNHAESVEDWLALQHQIKRRENAEKIQNRVAEINKQLIALGYQESEFPLPIPSTEWYKITRQPRNLTPQTWDGLRPRLEACIQREKTRREEIQLRGRRNERRSEVYPYLSQCMKERRTRDLQLYMSQMDGIALPTVQAMLTENDSSVPITEERWNESKVQVEKEMDEFSEKIRTDLISKIIIARKGAIPSSYDADPDTSAAAPSSRVDLAYLLSPTTYFECVPCRSSWCRYPDMLITHNHGWNPSWNAENFVFDLVITELAQALLASLPVSNIHDPREMIKKVFQCLRCGELKLSWHGLIAHFSLEHPFLVKEMRLNMEPNCHDIKLDPPLATILTAEEAAVERNKRRTPDSQTPEWME